MTDGLVVTWSQDAHGRPERLPTPASFGCAGGRCYGAGGVAKGALQVWLGWWLPQA